MRIPPRLCKRFPDQPLSQWLQTHPIEREHPEAVMIDGRPVLLTLLDPAARRRLSHARRQ